MKKIILIIAIILHSLACGQEEPSEIPAEPDPEPVPLIEEVPVMLACYQKTSSPDYPEGMGSFTELQAPGIPNNRELKLISETYDCLHGRGLITDDEHQCLFDDIKNLRIVIVEGLLDNDCYECGSGITCAGQIRDEFIVLNDPNYTDDTLRHEICHRAKHLTDGERGHSDTDWWHEGINDCVCERVIL